MELSFIRCPSCKSLVPASAKTCRMCGAPLVEETPSRERVHTSAEGDQRFSEIVKRVREAVSSEGFSGKKDTKLEKNEKLNQGDDFEEEYSEADSGEEEIFDEDLEADNLDFDDEGDGEDDDYEDFEKLFFDDEGESVNDEEPSDKIEAPSSYGVESNGQQAQNLSQKETERFDGNIETGSLENDGVLRGWLAITDGYGQSVELRTGKFLITSKQLRGNNREIVIPDESISVPHAIIHVPDKGALKVMDLMSDSGTYVEHGKERKKIDSLTEVSNGDWIMIGNIRLLCVLFR